ncbi:MAG: response regulator [Gemmatimonadetes bacterium]|nr:response regulator [Gemmatimonadota bacterium]
MATVLVIDDDPQIRRVLRRFIEREGHDVVEAEDGKVALRRFVGEPTDMVITDIYMPEMDGIELLIRLRETFPETKLVAMSGGGAIAAGHLLRAASALGAIAVLEKPFDLDVVREILEKLPPRARAS